MFNRFILITKQYLELPTQFLFSKLYLVKMLLWSTKQMKNLTLGGMILCGYLAPFAPSIYNMTWESIHRQSASLTNSYISSPSYVQDVSNFYSHVSHRKRTHKTSKDLRKILRFINNIWKFIFSPTICSKRYNTNFSAGINGKKINYPKLKIQGTYI